ncbi:amino acid adenylation domain-containing protein [Dokdonella sp.]|uniref:amino acid adenylation domain-containing protein n=1 Tax=Dokdonella sp. TaxID=2291710 RepID=UPI0031BE5420|nr:amino acid adenylation domain-containing protein [Dokdonella sp.]
MNVRTEDHLVEVDYDPFAQAPLARVVPSTEAQREIWLAASLAAEASLAYNESATLHLHGALDAAALQAALTTLVERHEALRATVSADGQHLCIAEPAACTLTMHDLAALAPDAREDAIADTLQRAVATPFDLERGPLFAAELLRLGADEHILLLNAHHIICDGWSFGVIVRELAALYAAAHERRAAALPPADSFAGFALAASAASATTQAHEDYWLARFSPPPAPLELPLDRPRPRQRNFASRRIDHHLDAPLVTRLRAAGASQGASLYAVLLTAFGTLLQRLSGQDDLVVGVPAAGQATSGARALVGHAVNVLPLRMRAQAAMPFEALLREVRADLLDAFDHPQYTFGTLLQRLALPRDPTRLPLVGVLFNLDQALEPGSIDFGGLDFEFAGVPRSHENFELFINAVQAGGGLRLECQYNTDLFDAATIERWLDAYATLLDALVANPRQTLAALPILSPRERAALAALQPAPAPRAAGRRVEALVFAQARRTPERVALRCGGQTWTYAQLAARARGIAAALGARGIGAGALVGIALERDPDLVAATLGVLAAGAGYVPLDPAFPADRLAYMATDAQLALLLAGPPTAGRFDWPAARTLLLDDPAIPADAPDLPPAQGDDAIAYVIYTSGSTGKPKGVCVPQAAVVNFLLAMQSAPGIQPDDRLLAVTTLSFDIAVLELFLPLTCGATVVLASHGEALDGHALGALIERHAVTLMQATPASWRLLLEAGWPGRAGLRAVCGGEPLPRDLAEALLQRCAALWNLYGPTETTVWSTAWRVEAPQRGIRIGRPIDNTTVWVLDALDQPCPIGVAGEIAIGGRGVALGYLGRPELTAERFIADPFSQTPGARLYRTGDRGRWRNDGLLEHFGRLDFQVKLRGFRIELGEVEANLVSHPSVARAVALVREDRPGDQRLVAYLTPAPGATPQAQELRRHLRQTLPDYMLPQHYLVLATIPQLPNGKIDRKALPAPTMAKLEAAAAAPPRNTLERRIGAAMEEVLALPGLGRHDDFFRLGGHSLLAAQLTARLAKEFGVPLSLRTLFDAPTIAGLADLLAARQGTPQAPRIEPRADQHLAPLSRQQTRLWLFDQLHPGNLVYNTPSAHRLRGALDEPAFAQAFRALLARQSSLRTSIGHLDGEPVQVIHEDIPLALFPAEDLASLAADVREATLMRRLDELTNQPFDLASAPLFRVHLFRLADDEHVLFFMPHHIIWDGWSFDLFYAEFAALYAACQAGLAAQLPPLPVSYGDFAAWQQRWLAGPEYATQLQAQLAAWHARLARHGPPPPLPTDRPRPPALSLAATGATEWLQVSRAQTEALRALGQRADATLFMTLLAVFYTLLYRYIGATQLVVGTPARVRSAAEVEKLMGLFTNLLPLPLDLDPASRFLDLVGAVRQVVLDGFAHPDVQLDDLLRERDLRAAVGTTQLYQAQFSYQDARQRIVDWGGLAQTQIPIFQRGTSEDLSLWLLEHNNGMLGGAIYNADTLDATTVQRLCADYLDLLDRVLAHPEQSIAALAAPGAGQQRMPEPAAPAPAPAAQGGATPAAPAPADAPASAAECFLADLWAELIGVPRVGLRDNFFDLGGHSLLAVEMASRVERRTGVRLNLLRIASTTLAGLAAELPRELPAAPPATLGGRMRKLLGLRA